MKIIEKVEIEVWVFQKKATYTPKHARVSTTTKTKQNKNKTKATSKSKKHTEKFEPRKG